MEPSFSGSPINIHVDGLTAEQLLIIMPPKYLNAVLFSGMTPSGYVLALQLFPQIDNPNAHQDEGSLEEHLVDSKVHDLVGFIDTLNEITAGKPVFNALYSGVPRTLAYRQYVRYNKEWDVRMNGNEAYVRPKQQTAHAQAPHTSPSSMLA